MRYVENELPSHKALNDTVENSVINGSLKLHWLDAIVTTQPD